MQIKTIDLLKEGTLLPPAEGKCQECGREHSAELPHDNFNIFYKMWFKKKHDRWPTWEDAMAHCTEDVKKAWRESMQKQEERRKNKGV